MQRKVRVTTVRGKAPDTVLRPPTPLRNAKTGHFVAGVVQTNGKVSDGKPRFRQSGQLVAQAKVRSPMSAIRAKCVDCSGGSFGEVQFCTATGCPLYAYRFGKRPATVAKRAAAKAQSEAERRGRLGGSIAFPPGRSPKPRSSFRRGESGLLQAVTGALSGSPCW